MRGPSGEPAPVFPHKAREGGLGPDFHCPRSRTRLKPTLQAPELVCGTSSLPPRDLGRVSSSVKPAPPGGRDD